jgi:glycosyltransferase involved in cell wall biosynthesis
MQNVLFFLFRLYGGGAERVVSNLSMDLAGHCNIKIAVFDSREETYPFSGELIRIKLPFSQNTAGNNLLARGVRLLVLLYKLRKIKKQHQIDVAISFAEQANIINVLTKGKIRTILSVRTLLSKQIIESPNALILGFLVRLLYNRSDLVVAPSKRAAEDLQEKFGVSPAKMKVIYNYIDQRKVGDLSRLDIQDTFHRQLFDRPVLLNVGRVTPAKGQWILLEVMRKITIQYPDWKLVIMGGAEGEGHLKSQLSRMASSFDLKLFDGSEGIKPSMDYDIYLLGFQNNPFCYMRRSKVLLFPSVFEGFPNTVLEAMECNLPVISADCQAGPREILAPGTEINKNITRLEITPYGILCPAISKADVREPVSSGLIEEWMNALTLLINDPVLKDKLVENGRRRVLDFDRLTIVEQWKNTIAGH